MLPPTPTSIASLASPSSSSGGGPGHHPPPLRPALPATRPRLAPFAHAPGRLIRGSATAAEAHQDTGPSEQDDWEQEMEAWERRRDRTRLAALREALSDDEDGAGLLLEAQLGGEQQLTEEQRRLLSTSASLRSRARFVSSPSDRHVLLKEASDLIFEAYNTRLPTDEPSTTLDLTSQHLTFALSRVLAALASLSSRQAPGSCSPELVVRSDDPLELRHALVRTAPKGTTVRAGNAEDPDDPGLLVIGLATNLAVSTRGLTGPASPPPTPDKP